MAKQRVELTINGRTYSDDVEPRTLLSDFIRHHAGLTGTHVGCEHGVCGCCTVLIDGKASLSCLAFACQVEGQHVETVESLGADQHRLSTLQNSFWEKHGLQCGFCTPGMLMVATELLRENRRPSREEIRDAISGVLCRCTGYQNSVAAIEHAAGAGADVEVAK
jgi:aerobic-type carbon monoxide dehydrogenase small subunit (CoxS/CutS family)